MSVHTKRGVSFTCAWHVSYQVERALKYEVQQTHMYKASEGPLREVPALVHLTTGIAQPNEYPVEQRLASSSRGHTSAAAKALEALLSLLQASEISYTSRSR